MKLALALIALLPVAAAAEEEGPVTSPSQVGTTTTTTTTAGPEGTTTTTTTTTAPDVVAPIAPAPAAPVLAHVDENPCGAYGHAKWRQRMKGRLSIGFSKSHVELEDDQGEGKQRSFVARINGRRGWAIELEMSKLTLDGGDTAKTGGISLVKMFGKRRLAPYVLAGGGGGKYETVDGVEDRIRFGEVGAGVMLRGKRFSVGIDMRRGVRGFKDRDDAMAVDRGSTMPGADDDHDHDHYTRGRIVGLVTF